MYFKLFWNLSKVAYEHSLERRLIDPMQIWSLESRKYNALRIKNQAAFWIYVRSSFRV